MTNEQAKFLYSIADSMGTTGIEDFTCKDGEKMREIINALEQSTSDDCVSREQALLSLTGENLSTKSAEELIALFDKRIKALPPVTPTFPKEKTNGDVTMAMFPTCRFSIEGNWVHIELNGRRYSFCPVEFWNRPYKRGNENVSS